MADDAYLTGLKMLARRERSERQVRERLADRGFDDEAIDAAVQRLKADRSLDDNRFARAMARLEVNTKRHGRLRAQRQIESCGISPALAREALDEVFATVDQDTLIESALARRLRGSRSLDDEAEFRRLYRFLIGQGFQSDQVLRTLKAHRKRS